MNRRHGRYQMNGSLEVKRKLSELAPEDRFLSRGTASYEAREHVIAIVLEVVFQSSLFSLPLQLNL